MRESFYTKSMGLRADVLHVKCFVGLRTFLSRRPEGSARPYFAHGSKHDPCFCVTGLRVFKEPATRCGGDLPFVYKVQILDHRPSSPKTHHPTSILQSWPPLMRTASTSSSPEAGSRPESMAGPPSARNSNCASASRASNITARRAIPELGPQQSSRTSPSPRIRRRPTSSATPRSSRRISSPMA
jgi:hypothetical protein